MRRALLAVGILATSLAWGQKPISVTFLHHNDLHGHVEPTIIRGKPYGGYARIATLVKQFRQTDPNVIYVDAGDVMQGTLFFNVYEGLADLAILNAIGLDVMALGNHEFDKGPPVLARFLQNVTFPVISSNIDLTNEPTLRDRVKPTTVVEIGGEKVGFVGAMTPELPEISSPGPTVGMKDLVPTVQKSIDELMQQGINKIIVISHSGFNEDRQMAARLRGADAIIGGHSHTPLGIPEIPGWPRSGGAYPTLVKDATGRETPIFQAWEWGKVLGRFRLDFDEKGEVVRIVDAKPIIVDETVPEDPVVKSMIAAYKLPIAALQNQPVGEAAVELPRSPLPTGENILANVIADAMLAATTKNGAVAAFTNSGGVRAPLAAGTITYGDAIGVVPFNNTLVVMDLSGEELTKAVERGLGEGGMLLPSKGVQYRYDPSRPDGNRLLSFTINGKAVDPRATYRVTVNSFIASGGDGQVVLRDAKGYRLDTGLLDIDAFVDFIRANSPLRGTPENRVVRGRE